MTLFFLLQHDPIKTQVNMMLTSRERANSGGHTYKVDMCIISSLKTGAVEVGDVVAKEKI